MNIDIPRSKHVYFAILGLLGALLALPSAAPAADAAMAEMDKEAHERTAAAYEDEVKLLQEKIAQHEQMAKMYDSMARSGTKHGSHGMAAHCKNIIRNYNETIGDAKELAKYHHMMAEEMK